MSSPRSRNLLAIGSAAVIAAYAAGFLRTAEAARRIAEGERRRPAPDDIRETRAVRQEPDVGNPVKEAEPGLAVAPSPAAIADAPVPSSQITTAAAVLVAQRVEAAAPAPVAATTPTPPPASAPAASAASPVPAAAASPAPIAPVAAVTAAAAPAKVPRWADGRYFGWGTCRHGQLKVLITIKDELIVDCVIDECYTNYSKDSVQRLNKEVVTRQGYPVSVVSGATQSSDAFYYAVVEAIAAAKRALTAK